MKIYVLYGKERKTNTGVHPISLHYSWPSALVAFLTSIPIYEKLSIK